MSSVVVETISQRFRKARSVNQTSSSYVAKIPTITRPFGDAGTATGSSVIDLGDTGLTVQNYLMIVPYGVGSNNNTFSLRVIGWDSIKDPSSNNLLWIPINLIELAITLSSTNPGITSYPVLGTELFADTITVTKGSTLAGEAASENIMSPADDTIAHALLDIKGMQKIELTFTTGGSATSCNALLRLL